MSLSIEISLSNLLYAQFLQCSLPLLFVLTATPVEEDIRKRKNLIRAKKKNQGANAGSSKGQGSDGPNLVWHGEHGASLIGAGCLLLTVYHVPRTVFEACIRVVVLKPFRAIWAIVPRLFIKKLQSHGLVSNVAPHEQRKCYHNEEKGGGAAITFVRGFAGGFVGATLPQIPGY